LKESKLMDLPSLDESKLTERRMEFVHAEEDNVRELTWEILREAVDNFADEVPLEPPPKPKLTLCLREMFKHARC
jgi:hypothetical protein